MYRLSWQGIRFGYRIIQDIYYTQCRVESYRFLLYIVSHKIEIANFYFFFQITRNSI